MDKREEEIRRVRNLISDTERKLNDLRIEIKKVEKENQLIESDFRQKKKEYDQNRIMMEDLGRKKESNIKELYEKNEQERYFKKELNRLLVELEQAKSGSGIEDKSESLEM